MPFAVTLEQHRLVERVIRVRLNPYTAYGSAVAAVAIAALVREGVSETLGQGPPFITFYPAIVIAALLGGFWPGVLAIALSSVVASYAFVPPYYSFALDSSGAAALALFVTVGIINVCVVTWLNAFIERVLTQQKNMRVLIESAPNGIVVVDDQGQIRLLNQSAEMLFGYKRDELLGRNVELLVPERQVGAHAQLRQSFQANPETRPMGAGRDLSGRRKDGSEFPLEIGLSPIRARDKDAVLATVIDISERRRAQDRQRFLVEELQHRTKNLFAVMQVIASRSLTEGRDVSEARLVFTGRLTALANAYATLAEAAWHGASLREILNREFTSFSDRLSVAGCDVFVTPNAAQQFALIAHELATNSMKYGALSVPDGHVSIEGAKLGMDGNALFSFHWKETGGPSVTTPPKRRGFGSAILLDAAKHFGKTVDLKYEADGLSYRLEVSLGAIEATRRVQPADMMAAN